MKSALEMFKELGYYLHYKKVSDITNITYMKYISGERRKVISFNRYKNEAIEVTTNTCLLHNGKQSTYLCNDLSEKELKAISKQIDELGGGIMTKEELLKKIMELPKEESKNSATSFCGINVEDLMITINRFDKIPTYDELLRENKRQQEVIDKITSRLEYYLIGNLKYQSAQEEFINLLAILNEVSE